MAMNSTTICEIYLHLAIYFDQKKLVRHNLITCKSSQVLLTLLDDIDIPYFFTGASVTFIRDYTDTLECLKDQKIVSTARLCEIILAITAYQDAPRLNGKKDGQIFRSIFEAEGYIISFKSCRSGGVGASVRRPIGWKIKSKSRDKSGVK